MTDSVPLQRDVRGATKRAPLSKERIGRGNVLEHDGGGRVATREIEADCIRTADDADHVSAGSERTRLLGGRARRSRKRFARRSGVARTGAADVRTGRANPFV